MYFTLPSCCMTQKAIQVATPAILYNVGEYFFFFDVDVNNIKTQNVTKHLKEVFKDKKNKNIKT